MSKVFRYLVSGGVTAGVQLGLFYLLTDILGIWYLASSTVAVAAAITVSFLLQKFWTFENRDLSEVQSQAAKFLTLSLCNFAVNAALMYSFVDVLQLQHMVAQILSMAIIAAYGFFIYKYLIFT